MVVISLFCVIDSKTKWDKIKDYPSICREDAEKIFKLLRRVLSTGQMTQLFKLMAKYKNGVMMQFIDKD